MFLEDGKPVPARARRGGLAVGVPGEVRGLAELVKRFGKRSFARLRAPGRAAGPRGFPVTRRLALAVDKTRFGHRRPAPIWPPSAPCWRARCTYKPPLHAGDRVTPARRWPRPCARLRQRGPEAFYAGPIALEIVEAVKDAGGVMSPEDLRRYTVVERDADRDRLPRPPGVLHAAAVVGRHRASPRCWASWPSAGGPSRRTGCPRQSSAYLHVLAEALKHGFADRARLLGDPDFVEVPIARLLDPAYHRQLAARIDDKRVLASDQYGMGPGPRAAPGRRHRPPVGDRRRGQRRGADHHRQPWFGAHLLAGKTGIVLNNEMDDFSLAPDTPNAFGLVGNGQNAVAAGQAAAVVDVADLVLEGDAVKMVVGGAGGPTIISGTLQVLLNVLDGKHGRPGGQRRPPHPPPVAARRCWPSSPTSPADVVEGLERRGHKTSPRDPDHPALVNVVVRTAGGLEAAAEFRSGGAPAGY